MVRTRSRELPVTHERGQADVAALFSDCSAPPLVLDPKTVDSAEVTCGRALFV